MKIRMNVMKTRALITSTLFFLIIAVHLNASQPVAFDPGKDSNNVIAVESELAMDRWMLNFDEANRETHFESTEANLEMESWMLDFENTGDRSKPFFPGEVLKVEDWMLGNTFTEEEISLEDWMI